MRPTIAAAAFAALCLSACAASTAPSGTRVQAVEAPRPTVTVTRDGEVWTADYVLDRDAVAWAFVRSALIQESRRPWRLEQWRVTTPGVVLERVGTRDILRAVDGGPVPRRVSITFTPKHENLEADYAVLVFTDGSVAVPSAQFDLFSLESLEAVRAVPGDLNGYAMTGGPAAVTWRDRAGPILFRGERVAEATAVEADTYVLFGRAGVVESERLTTVRDPQLPDWIGGEIETFAPRVADHYARRLGPGQSDKPTVMMSWSGPTPGMTSMGGSVMPGLIVMNFEGTGVLQPTARMRSTARWFIGHESAHFWLGQTVRYQFTRDAWITEGGADLMAVRAFKAIDPAYDAQAELQREVEDCVTLADAPVADAGGRGEHRAYYACGAVFALAAEGAQRRATGGDWFDFLKPLIDANRADGVLTREAWLEALTRVSGDASLRRDIEVMLDAGVADPAAMVAGLFERTGVAYRLEAGRVVLA